MIRPSPRRRPPHRGHGGAGRVGLCGARSGRIVGVVGGRWMVVGHVWGWLRSRQRGAGGEERGARSGERGVLNRCSLLVADCPFDASHTLFHATRPMRSGRVGTIYIVKHVVPISNRAELGASLIAVSLPLHHGTRLDDSLTTARAACHGRSGLTRPDRAALTTVMGRSRPIGSTPALPHGPPAAPGGR